jgi:hypothetical protein
MRVARKDLYAALEAEPHGPTLHPQKRPIAPPGPAEFGEELMTIEVDDTVNFHRFAPPNR